MIFFFLYVKLALPGIEPMPPAVEPWSLNHWTPGEVLYDIMEVC